MASDSYEDIVEGTIDEVKEAVQENDVDLEQLLQAEKDNKDRKTLKSWLEGRIEEQSSAEETADNGKYCSSCGEKIKDEAEICPHCGVRQSSSKSYGIDRVTAGIFALLLGGIGAHKFYMKDTDLGVLYLCFFWTGIPAIVGFIEGILYLTKTDEEFQEQYVRES